MADLITAVCATAYLAVALWTMRWLYGRWRAQAIDGHFQWLKSLAVTGKGPDAELLAEAKDSFDRGGTQSAAFFTGLAWPVALIVIGVSAVVGRLMDGTPVRSRAELRVALAERERRIGELERELGIGGGRG